MIPYSTFQWQVIPNDADVLEHALLRNRLPTGWSLLKKPDRSWYFSAPYATEHEPVPSNHSTRWRRRQWLIGGYQHYTRWQQIQRQQQLNASYNLDKAAQGDTSLPRPPALSWDTPRFSQTDEFTDRLLADGKDTGWRMIYHRRQHTHTVHPAEELSLEPTLITDCDDLRDAHTLTEYHFLMWLVDHRESSATYSS